MTTVGILDMREIWSAGAAALAAECRLQVTGCWSDVRSALPALMKNPPDVLMLSAALLEQACASQFANLKKRPSIILVLEPGEPLNRETLAQFPFEGVIFRDTPVRAVQECLKSVAAGQAWLDVALFSSLDIASHRLDWQSLTARELEIARLAAHGLSNKRIAKALHVSDGTVKMHMHHILAKLHVARRADLDSALHSPGRDHSLVGREMMAEQS